jgi:hypothetical protein
MNVPFSILTWGLVALMMQPPLSSFGVAQDLQATWENRYLTIRGDFPGKEIRIHYLEAYCRPGSTDREWGKTVIRHESELTEVADDGKTIRLLDRLEDGVRVEHEIRVQHDRIQFVLKATNPTNMASEVAWAQPCVRVDRFTGQDPKDSQAVYPPYVRHCFMLIDGTVQRLPTQPWARDARYTPGQVYCPEHVDRNDVNPRPLSPLRPSHGLCGCYGSDPEWILGMTWEPYQEIFQGVITCIHNDFRIGGLQPGETKTIRGAMYVHHGTMDALLARYRRDFPKQSQGLKLRIDE